MIQLSDTKAAPGLGALLGQKPKAGGDTSAFALALGDLAAEGQSAFSMPLPRQAIAADGSPLPEDQIEAETGEALGAEIGLLLSVMPLVPAARSATPPDIGIDGAPTLENASEPVVPTSAASPRSLNPEITADKTVDVAGAKPLNPDSTTKRPATDAPVPSLAPAAILRAPFARPAADTPRPAPIAPDATPLPAIAPPVPQPASVDAASALRTEKAGMTVPSANISLAAQPARPVTPNLIPSEAALPVAAFAMRANPAVATRLQSAPANAASAREGATVKTLLDPAAARTLAVKVEASLPTPAKFVPIERAAGAPSDRAAPRRVAIALAVPTTTTVSALPVTVADLIPTEQRPRMSATPIAPVTDPASIGVSAPVEAASNVADPTPIDTQATDWIEGMIEQIDVMRDAHAEGASETTTTRIRLSPDALGGIEIVLSGEGEAIDVRINADTSAARALLAEAAPRLTDMAEARGLKLGQGDAGQPGQHQPQRQQDQDQPTTNRGRTTDSATTGGNPDERIA
ncbi:flagellar hook-length control protein FliK [Sphingomonas sp. AX6]|uniref:flagellar hook-length control protein FliK n=1 Tax=Sphingomonas sp. AX6 TaxID=2653171 RepID=UPI0012EF5DA9|nr:flagellar hook-length control protein FliK [Sphingomonas sp. AX6]VXC70277.1 Flagellar hook-length control protein fliK [Sphingomonas sp. AX6]